MVLVIQMTWNVIVVVVEDKDTNTCKQYWLRVVTMQYMYIKGINGINIDINIHLLERKIETNYLD
jgi:3-polyprenyl-4-hydroxybenzoate decarboxylase